MAQNKPDKCALKNAYKTNRSAKTGNKMCT